LHVALPSRGRGRLTRRGVRDRRDEQEPAARIVSQQQQERAIERHGHGVAGRLGDRGRITAVSVGRGGVFYVISFAVTVALALAANTSFGGLPVLGSLLARDSLAPHVFGLRADRPVYRYGVVGLALLAGVLLVAVNGNTNALIPLYAIGVFTGFTLSQPGLVRHWHKAKPPRWWAKAALNSLGAVMTGAATVISLVTKFVGGAWVVAVAVPALMLLFHRTKLYYREASNELGIGTIPDPPRAQQGLVIVAVQEVSKLTEEALTVALSFGDKVIALNVSFDDDAESRIRADWDRWSPNVDLVVLRPTHRSIIAPIRAYIASPEVRAHTRVMVLIPQVEPRRWRDQLLQKSSSPPCPSTYTRNRPTQPRPPCVVSRPTNHPHQAKRGGISHRARLRLTSQSAGATLRRWSTFQPAQTVPISTGLDRWVG
jgi:hypothetical protein